jgi:adenylate kinase family enzyme
MLMGDNMYQNGKIYKIVDNGYNLCYYGSTCQPLSKRLSTHKKDYQRYTDGRKDRPITLCKIFDEYGVNNCKIELVELFACNSKEELHKREGEFIRENECVNKFIPGRTQAEYAREHRPEAAARMRKFRSTLSEEKKEAIRQKQKEYREQNKDELSLKRMMKVLCHVCGTSVCFASIARHENTLKHQNKLNEIKNQHEAKNNEVIEI